MSANVKFLLPVAAVSILACMRILRLLISKSEFFFPTRLVLSLIAMELMFTWKFFREMEKIESLVRSDSSPHQSSPFLESWISFAKKTPSRVDSCEESVRLAKQAMDVADMHVNDLIRLGGSRKLFEMHREAAHLIECGVGIRLSAHFNLFAGSVANLGDEMQRQWLEGVLNRRELGCFALTEESAGVLSGFIVETECRVFGSGLVLHTPRPEARKKWISNGLHASHAVVVARLILRNGTDKGPHAFLVRDLDKVKGVTMEDMSPKTAFNGLDNAIVEFNEVTLPMDAMLSDLSYLDAGGLYHLRDATRPFNFLHMATRLLAGRICLAGASLAVIWDVIEAVENYATKRHIPVSREETVTLFELPVFAATIDRLKRRWAVLYSFVQVLEQRYVSERIEDELVELIATAKVECVDFALRSYYELKERVGAFAIQGHSPFTSEREAMLYCLRFAEGDSAILLQKIARNKVKRYHRYPASMLTDLLALPLYLARRHAWEHILLTGHSIWLTLKLLFAKNKNASWLQSHELVELIARTQIKLHVLESTSPNSVFYGHHIESLTTSRQNST